MAESTDYVPPKVWKWDKPSGGQFAHVNRPTAGATHDKPLQIGKHPMQLYSLATPNGVKVTIMLEELLALGHYGAEYDAWPIQFKDGDQFGSGFVEVNPNSKIPALMDRSTPIPTRIFESGSILLYLAEKFRALLPADPTQRAESISWLFWQMSNAAYLGGGFGHFYIYAPFRIEYAINRFAMEVKRQYDVLDQHLANNKYFAGDEYTIADIAMFPWYGATARGELYRGETFDTQTFLELEDYRHVQRWAKDVAARYAVQRGRMVNRFWGDPAGQLHERHDASDFARRTLEKLTTAIS
jgi:GST-like protein